MKILLTIAFIFFSWCINAQQISRGLNGKVKEVVEKQFAFSNQEEVFSRKIESFYNDKGGLISKFEYKGKEDEDYSKVREDESTHWDEDIFLAVEKNQYNANGELIQKFQNHKLYTEDKVFRYFKDENGNDTLIEVRNSNDVLIERIRCFYDANGNLIRWEGFDLKREFVSTKGKVTYKFHDNGTLKERQVDSTIWKYAFPLTIHEYDDKGHLLESYHLNDSKEKIYHFKAEYVQGKLKKQTTYKSGRKNVVYTYNDQEEEISMEKFKNDELVFKRTYQYNEEGDVIKMELKQVRGNMTILWDFEYEYDTQGNWVKKTEKENGTVFKISRRQIQYYP
ncbi:MAG: hypothetical protein MI810_02885 [Flavobacteriales bacterium]|nr:hypothetical protein [Flavobacteriales bacterium]